MMKIEIQNDKLVPSINFLYGLKLSRKYSRFRRRLIEQLRGRLKVVEDDRNELLKEHAKKDENGEPLKANGNYAIEDMVALNADLKELYAEKMVIEGGDNREMIRTIKQVLKKFENEEYEADDSDAYDYLCDQFNVDEEDDAE